MNIRRHSRFRKRYIENTQRPVPGTAPGSLQHNPMHHPSELYVMGYGPEGYIEQKCHSAADVARFMQAWPVVWVNVIGLGNVELIEQLGVMFGLERLLLEDVLDTSHRPKVEYYEQYVFAILKGGTLAEQFEAEQISVFLKKNIVIAFEEKPKHSFDQVRERIRRGTGKIRTSGSDYLFYALMDEVVDKYFPILDQLNRTLSGIEDMVMTSPSTSHNTDLIQQIHHTKSDLLLLHRTIWPMSDVITVMMREDHPLVTKQTRNYLRDCYDHSVQANDLAQFYRDTAAGLLNTYLAYEGHKTNEIIKLLTLVTSVFIPLNFIASIYGMNFKYEYSPFNMPELEWRYGYPFALGLMASVALALLLYFRKRGWIWAK